MATYLIVNLLSLVAAAIVCRVAPKKPSKVTVITLAALLTLTAVFDSLIVGFGIVGYNPDLILGVYIGKAPIEDFFYAVLAVLLVPAIWNRLEAKHARKN